MPYLHRNAAGDPAAFAQSFIASRLLGFDKDMRICLTPTKSETRAGVTHAYFPGMAACCSTIEYLAALHRGDIHRRGWMQVRDFATLYLPQPAFDSEAVRVLFQALRNPVAHRGIASGVWVEQGRNGVSGRRLVWKITAESKFPAFQVVAEQGVLIRDPPWPTPYTHRVRVHLRRLWIDTRNAAIQYSNDLQGSPELLSKFHRCMKQLYPL